MNKPIAEENLGLVHLCANRFRGRGIEYDDLYSAGCIGLLKAVEAFDSERRKIFNLCSTCNTRRNKKTIQRRRHS